MTEDEEKVSPRQTAFLAGRRVYVGTKGLAGLLAAAAAAGYPATVSSTGEPPPEAPVVKEPHRAEPEEADDERNARIRRGRHAVQKGHRVEIHGGKRAVIVQVQSRRGPERNKYADLPRGTVSTKKRERLARKNGAE